VGERGAAFVARPLAAPRNRGGHIDGKLALAITGLARKGGVLTARKPPRPQEINLLRRDVCRAPREQIGVLRKPGSLIISGGLAVALGIRCTAGRVERVELVGRGVAVHVPSSLGATR